MPAKKRKSRKRRIKTGSAVSTKKGSRKSRGKQGSSILRSVVIKLITFIIFLASFAWLAYAFLLPYWVFSGTSPENILITPRNVEEGRDVLLFAHVDSNPDNRSLHLINGSTKVSLVGGYGEYELQNIYPLLKMDGKNEQFILASFNHALGVVLDEVLTVEQITPEIIGRGQTLSVFYQEIKAQPSLIKQYLQIYYLTRELDGELEVYSREDLVKAVSNYQTLGAQTARSCPVAVINTTNKNDFAGDISTIIEQNGGLVVRISNDSSKFSKSSLYISMEASENCQPMTSLIKGIFPSSLEIIPANDTLTDSYRAELILFLGEDAAQSLGSGI